MQCVLRGSTPWFFVKALLLLTEVKRLEVPVGVLLREKVFWVRVHGLPPVFMSQRMREELGVVLGRLVAMDCGVDGMCLGEFMRIKVANYFF